MKKRRRAMKAQITNSESTKTEGTSQNTADFPCAGYEIHTADGDDYDCEYDYGDDCQECMINGGPCDPRYPKYQSPREKKAVLSHSIQLDPDNLETELKNLEDFARRMDALTHLDRTQLSE